MLSTLCPCCTCLISVLMAVILTEAECTENAVHRLGRHIYFIAKLIMIVGDSSFERRQKLFFPGIYFLLHKRPAGLHGNSPRTSQSESCLPALLLSDFLLTRLVAALRKSPVGMAWCSASSWIGGCVHSGVYAIY